MVLVEISLESHQDVVVLDGICDLLKLLRHKTFFKEVCNLTPIVFLRLAQTTWSVISRFSDRDICWFCHVILNSLVLERWSVVAIWEIFWILLFRGWEALSLNHRIEWCLLCKSCVIHRDSLLNVLVLQDSLERVIRLTVGTSHLLGHVVSHALHALLVNVPPLFLVELAISDNLANDIVLVEGLGPTLRDLVLDLILY